MNISKKAILAGLAVASISGVGFFSQNVFAQSPGDFDTLAKQIATRFDLKQEEVRTVLEDFKKEKEIERQAKFNQKLDQAVTSGQLTEPQKAAILEKRQEIKNRLTKIKTDNDENKRHTALKQLRDEVKVWATDNSIPLRWLRAAGHTH